jgi:hypothetical protein
MFSREVAVARRIVRRDAEAEKDLQQVRQEAARTPYVVFKELDLGPGGYSIEPSTDSRRAVRAAICRRIRR